MTLKVDAVPCLEDNYLWLLKDVPTGMLAVCDPARPARPSRRRRRRVAISP